MEEQNISRFCSFFFQIVWNEGHKNLNMEEEMKKETQWQEIVARENDPKEDEKKV